MYRRNFKQNRRRSNKSLKLKPSNTTSITLTCYLKSILRDVLAIFFKKFSYNLITSNIKILEEDEIKSRQSVVINKFFY